MNPYPEPLSVGDVSRHISGLLEKDGLLQNLVVRGEIREIHKHRSGHTYFTIGDSEGTLQGVLFKGDAWRQIFWPLSGDEVFVEGRVGVYALRGTYQLYARRFLPLGKGAKARAKAAVEAKLRKEGVFDPRLKRPFPPFPERVGVITAPGGAAVRDVAAVAAKRFPRSKLYVFPSLVQGNGTVPGVCAALERLRTFPGLDAVMLVRGGGARDELSPFDDEDLVRGVRLSPIPLVTGIGHQRDLSLADLAADAHTPTPSAAAEFLFPDREELSSLLGNSTRRLHTSWTRQFVSQTEGVDSRGGRLAREWHRKFFPGAREAEEKLEALLCGSMERLAGAWKARLDMLEKDLHAKAPQHILSRGYVFCTTAEGIPLCSADQVQEGEILELHFSRGHAEVRVLRADSTSLLEG